MIAPVAVRGKLLLPAGFVVTAAMPVIYRAELGLVFVALYLDS